MEKFKKQPFVQSAALSTLGLKAAIAFRAFKFLTCTSYRKGLDSGDPALLLRQRDGCREALQAIVHKVGFVWA